MSYHENLSDNNENCSFREDELDKMCSNEDDDACGDGLSAVKKRQINN